MKSRPVPQKLTSEQKQAELERHRAILLATFDYMQLRVGGGFVFDGVDPGVEYCQQQKDIIENNFNQNRLHRLQKKLEQIVRQMQRSTDMNFGPYIREKTGFNLDIFEDLNKRVEIIVAQNEIRSKTEHEDIIAMVQFREKSADAKDVQKLKSLLIDYFERTKRKYNRGYRELSREVKEGYEVVSFQYSNGPKPKHFEENWVSSPNGQHRLRIAKWGKGDQSYTYVDIQFSNGDSGPLYAVKGICPDVKAWWKDNDTITIETRQDYSPLEQCREVRSFGVIVNVKYVEPQEKTKGL